MRFTLLAALSFMAIAMGDEGATRLVGVARYKQRSLRPSGLFMLDSGRIASLAPRPGVDSSPMVIEIGDEGATRLVGDARYRQVKTSQFVSIIE